MGNGAGPDAPRERCRGCGAEFKDLVCEFCGLASRKAEDPALERAALDEFHVLVRRCEPDAQAKLLREGFLPALEANLLEAAVLCLPYLAGDGIEPGGRSPAPGIDPGQALGSDTERQPATGHRQLSGADCGVSARRALVARGRLRDVRDARRRLHRRHLLGCFAPLGTVLQVDPRARSSDPSCSAAYARGMWAQRGSGEVHELVGYDPGAAALDPVAAVCQEDFVQITRIRAYQVALPLHEGSYKWSGGKSVSVFDSTIVAVETDAGIDGLGRGVPARAVLPARLRRGSARRHQRTRRRT